MVLAVNKVDLAGFEEAAFRRIADAYGEFAARFDFADIVAIPVSARFGDNVVIRSARTPWHVGPTLLSHLEAVDAPGHVPSTPFRFPVQWVNRSDPAIRGLAGTVAGGTIAAGGAVAVLPSGRSSTVARIVGPRGDVFEASAGEAVAIVLADEIDVVRGDVLAGPDSRPVVSDRFTARIIWLDEDDLIPSRHYHLRCGHAWTPAWVSAITDRVDIETLGSEPADRLRANEIGLCVVQVQHPIAVDTFAENVRTGAFILVDRLSDHTAGCGMIIKAEPARLVRSEPLIVSKAARASLDAQTPRAIWFTGLSGAGKSTIANIVERQLHQLGRHTYLLDGDNLRGGLNRDLGFSDGDRVENVRRAAEVARLFVDAGLIVLCSFISPFRAERAMVRDMFEPGEFVEVFVDTPLHECIRRDPNGLYERALDGRLPNFSGIDSVYEPPDRPDLILKTLEATATDLATLVVRMVQDRIVFQPLGGLPTSQS